MQMIDADTLEVCRFLKQKHIIIPPENQWLQGCISCFKSQQSHNIAAVKEFAYEQWLLADLKDVAAPSLPTNCFSAEKLILTGKYAVQINYFVNVAEPFYKQLQKIRRPQAETNLSVDTDKDKGVKDPSGHRALSFELSDGEVVIKGFEDSPIKALVEPFVPGTKVVLLGPIECRKGILLLKSANLKILGGEVEDLHIANAVENVLARCLGVDENSAPYGSLVVKNEIKHENLLDEDSDALLQLAEEMDNFDDIGTTRSSVIDSNSDSLPRKLDIRNSIGSSKEIRTSSHSEPQKLEVITIDDEDDDDFVLAAAQSASLAEKVAQPSQMIQKNLLGFVKTERVASREQSDPNSLRAQLEESYGDSTPTTHKPSTQVIGNERNQHTTYVSSRDSRKEVDSVVKQVRYSVDNEILDPIDENDALTLEPARTYPSTYEHTEESFPPTVYPASRLLHVEILRLVRKLEIKEDKWFLSASVSIKGCELEVDFNADVLNKMLGITARELHDARKEMKKNPEKKLQINEHLRNCQHRIRELKCEMKIYFENFIKNPEIVEIMDLH